MSKWSVFFMLIALCALNGCASINHKCDYLPSGSCWRDGRECHRDPETVGCHSNWSCGKNFHFNDQ